MHEYRNSKVAPRWKGLVVLLAIVAAFLGTRHHVLAGSEPTYRVAVAMSGGENLPGAEVLLVRRSGIESLGYTDGLGGLKVQRDVLEAPDALALLICHEGFFCGGWRMDEPDPLPGDEVFIALAPFAIP